MSGEPKKLLEQNLVWFVLGVIGAAIGATLAALAWLEGFVDARVATDDVVKTIAARTKDAILQDESAVATMRGEKGEPGTPAAFPSGAVVAFDKESGCPDGWASFTAGAGRVIVGVGKGDGLTNRNYRSIGGNENHLLTFDEMPIHTHNLVYLNYKVDWGEKRHYLLSEEMIGDATGWANTPTGSAGGGRAHNNMPPYISLHVCKKN